MRTKVLAAIAKLLLVAVVTLSGSAYIYASCLKHYHYTDTRIFDAMNGNGIRCKHWIQEQMCKDIFTTKADEGQPVTYRDYEIDWEIRYVDSCVYSCATNQLPQDSNGWEPVGGVLSTGHEDYEYCAWPDPS
jgi:hypothetical protein